MRILTTGAWFVKALVLSLLLCCGSRAEEHSILYKAYPMRATLDLTGKFESWSNATRVYSSASLDALFDSGFKTQAFTMSSSWE